MAALAGLDLAAPTGPPTVKGIGLARLATLVARARHLWEPDPTPFADDPVAGERDSFAAAMALLASAPDAPVYVYSAYERTSYRKLQARYPDVCSCDEIDALFDPARTVDLLTSIVCPLTEWPASDRSIKTLARMCGFEWRDSDPSGANSIEWFRSWQSTGDPATRERIVRYNEDDVIATRVLLDASLKLPIRA